MNFNAPNYKEHLKKIFQPKGFYSKKDFLYFLYMKKLLCP